MNVEDSFLVRDDLDNALFLDFLKEAEGFGSAPLEESAPVLLADDGFSALAYDVDLLNLLWESGCSLRAGGCLEVVSLRRIFIYLLLIAGYPHCAYIVGCGCEGSA